MLYKDKGIVIVLGPTAVGKSSTSIEIAKVCRGEIINCDSMQVYRGFDIGTDKVPLEQRQGIPHHLLDIVDPSVQFTAAQFISCALDSIRSIHSRNNLPIITGGTGLYLKTLLQGLFPSGKIGQELRQDLEREAEEKGLDHLWNSLHEVDPEYAGKIGVRDRIRIIRALEVFRATGRTLTDHFGDTKPFFDADTALKIGLLMDRQKLYRRIEARVDKMFASGILEETRHLLDSGIPADAPPFRALGYKHVIRVLRRELSLEEAISLTKRDTRHYAKRQLTWFKKMEDIQWFPAENTADVVATVKDNLIL